MDRAFVRAKGGCDKWHDYEMTIAPYENGRRTCPVPWHRHSEFSRGGDHLHAAPGGGREQGQSVSRRRALRRGEPIGAVLTILAAQLMIPAQPYFLSFAAGAMLYKALAE